MRDQGVFKLYKRKVEKSMDVGDTYITYTCIDNILITKNKLDYTVNSHGIICHFSINIIFCCVL